MWEIARILLETLSCTFLLLSLRALIIINFFLHLLTLTYLNDDGNPLGRYQQHSKISERTGDSYKGGRFYLLLVFPSLRDFFKHNYMKMTALLPQILQRK